MPARIEIPRDVLQHLYYDKGLTQEQIAQRFGCDTKTISNRMREYGMPTRTAGDYTRLEIPRDELERLYNQDRLSLEEMANRFNCSVAAIQNCLARHGIPTRPPGWNSVRRYVPDDVLARWSPQLAYVIGLIASDGYLDKDYNCVGLKSTDLELIKLYCQCLHLSENISIKTRHHPRWKSLYEVRLSDPVYRAFLESIGLTSAKSRTLSSLSIPDDVFPDFLRGYMDGDGCWYVYHRPPRKYLYAQITSISQLFLAWLQETVQRLTGLRGGISGVLLRYGGSKAVALGSWMYYSPSVPCLTRKRAIWEQFV